MQVSSVRYSNGRIRSAVPLEDSKIEKTTTRDLNHIAETRMSRVEMEREESVHDDLIFEYSNTYRAFSARARKSQNIMTIPQSDDENTDNDAEDLNDNNRNNNLGRKQRKSAKHAQEVDDDDDNFIQSPSRGNKSGKSSSKNKSNIQQDQLYDEEIELDDYKPTRNNSSVPRGNCKMK